MNIHITQEQQPASESPSKVATVIWIPTEDIVVHRVPKPTAPKRKWLELVAWQLEDRLLQAVDDMHFVIIGENTEQNADDTLEVIAVSKQKIKDWQEQASNAYLTNFSLLPDYLALPWEAGSVSVAQRDEVLLVRSGQFSGFAAHASLAEPMIEALQAETRTQISNLDWHLAKPLPAANLLSGEFRQKGSMAGPRLWWGIAALLVIVSGLYFVYPTADTSTSARQQTAAAQRAQNAETRANIANANNATASNATNTAQAVTSRPQRPLQINAELLGIVIDANSSSATIKQNGQPEKVFHLGDEIARGQKIKSIFATSVVIEQGSQEAELTLKKFDPLLEQEAQQSNSASNSQNGFSLANMFAAIPVQVDDYGSGLKLESLSEEMKMLADIHEGDIVVQVGNNGIQELMSDPAIWTSYSIDTELPVTVIRDGQELVISVNAFSLSAQLLPNFASELMP